MYKHRTRIRKPIKFSVSNPNFEFMGFEHLTKHNDEHPDELHRECMIRDGISLPDEKKTRGRKPGAISECSRCHREGHYAKTCLHAFDVLGNRIPKVK